MKGVGRRVWRCTGVFVPWHDSPILRRFDRVWLWVAHANRLALVANKAFAYKSPKLYKKQLRGLTPPCMAMNEQVASVPCTAVSDKRSHVRGVGVVGIVAPEGGMHHAKESRTLTGRAPL
jgi:hypothetical protein